MRCVQRVILRDDGNFFGGANGLHFFDVTPAVSLQVVHQLHPVFEDAAVVAGHVDHECPFANHVITPLRD